MKLIIDIENPYGPEVLVSDIQLDGQWVEFYGLLALQRTDTARRDEFTSAEQLHAMAQWGTKRPESVGKEVARHCKRLEARELPLFDSRGKTKLWRLNVAPETIEFRPGRASVRRWISSHTRKPALDGRWVDQLDALLAAQACVHSGEGANARDILRAIQDFVSPDFEAWAGLVDARATDQYIDVQDNPDVLDTLVEHWSGSGHVAGRSVAARIQARIAMRKRFMAPLEQYNKLAKVAAELEHSGDIGGLAAILNVLGILATRIDQPDEAVHHHLRASALFAIVADFSSLQGALFNVANARVKARQLAGEPPDELCLRLLDASLQTFSVGQDSVQAEIAGAHWAMDMGDVAKARQYIEAGVVLVTHLDSGFEQACFLFARARLELMDAQGEHDALRDLTTARREFLALGVEEPIADIDAMIEQAEQRR